jgi:hypothetical protein
VVFQRVRSGLVVRLRRVALLWAGAGCLVTLLAAWIFAGKDGWPTGTWVPLVLDACLILALVGIGWEANHRIRSRFTERKIAGAMEGAAGLGSGTLVGALELERFSPPGVSASLVATAMDRVARGLDLPEDHLQGRMGISVRGATRRAAWTLVSMAVLVSLTAVTAPERSRAAWLGLARPFRTLSTPVLPDLVVEPGDAEVPRGEDVVVTVNAFGRSRVELRHQADGDVPYTDGAAVRDGIARFTLRDVRVAVEYDVTAPDGVRVGPFRIVPVDPLFVNDVRLDLTFPPHTNRPPEEYRGSTPPLAVPVGTRFEIEGRASRPLGEARLVDAGGARVLDLDIEGPAFGATWTPGRSGIYPWVFSDEEGGTTEVIPAPLDITLVRDSAPAVRITAPGTDTLLPLDRRQPLVLEARDDYGVRTLEVVAYRITSFGERQEPRVLSLELGANRAVLARPILDVSEWGLVPGDTVRYFARAVDNGPAAHVSRTREYALWMSDASVLRRVAQRELEEAGQEVRDLAERAAEAARDTRNLELQNASRRSEQGGRAADDESGPGERVAFEEREAIQRALEGQEELQASIDSVRARLERTSEAMREAGASDPELARDLRELQELLSDALTPEMRQTLEELERQLEQTDGRQASATLDELREQQETLRDRLEDALGQFRRAAVEQDFRATTREAEELAMEEEALADAMREDQGLEARAEQQEALHERARAMDQRMETLAERLGDLGESDAAQEVGTAREQSSRAMDEMGDAAEAARRGEGSEAGERADQAAGRLSETAERLREAGESRAQDELALLQRALRRVADDALTLARREARLEEAMAEAGREELTELRGDVAAVQQGVRSITEGLSKVRNQLGSDPAPALSTILGQATAALGRTIEALPGGSATGSRPTESSTEAVDALNRAAFMATAAAGRTAEGQSGQAPGDLQSMLEALAQQQGQLNNQAGQILPMQLGSAGMQALMDQLAGAQQEVADGLGQAADQPGSEGALGDLESLAEEAEALAHELASGRLEAPTRARQERLFHRLLDASRGLQKDEFSERREAGAPGDVARTEVMPLDPEALDVLRFHLPSSDQLQRLSPAERRLVMQYFERLNREVLEEDEVERAGTDDGRVDPGGPQ